MKRLGLLLVVVAVVVVAAAGVALTLGPRATVQPIAFDHRLHVEELGSDCTDCHLYAETGVRATIPNIDLCADCHIEAQTDSAEEARLVGYIEAREPVPWKKVYWVPDDVYFSHRRHTSMAGLECKTCHGSVADREMPVTRRAVPISMDGCMECHDEKGVSNDCLLCHR